MGNDRAKGKHYNLGNDYYKYRTKTHWKVVDGKRVYY